MIGKSGVRVYGILGVGCLVASSLVLACSGGDETTAAAPESATPPPAATEQPANGAANTPAPTPAPSATTPVPPPAEAGAPLLAPQVLGARVVLWLRADVGVEGPAAAVTGWKDSSTYGNHAVTQGMSPIVAATDGIQGHPSLHFSGTTTFMSVADSASLQLGTDDVTAYAVVAHSSALAPASRMVFSKQGAAYPYKGFGLYVNYDNTYGPGTLLQYGGPAAKIAAAGPETYATNQALFMTARRTGAKLALDVGGTSVSASAEFNGAAVDLSNVSALRIGGQGTLGQALTGDISEIIIVKGAMTAAESKSVSDYLAKKYAD